MSNQTTWNQVSREVFKQVQVGKTYRFDGRRGRVVEKSEHSGQPNAAGWNTNGPMVRVTWKD